MTQQPDQVRRPGGEADPPPLVVPWLRDRLVMVRRRERRAMWFSFLLVTAMLVGTIVLAAASGGTTVTAARWILAELSVLLLAFTLLLVTLLSRLTTTASRRALDVPADAMVIGAAGMRLAYPGVCELVPVAWADVRKVTLTSTRLTVLVRTGTAPTRYAIYDTSALGRGGAEIEAAMRTLSRGTFPTSVRRPLRG